VSATVTDADVVRLGETADFGRWQPARAGLIGLWRYWDETFTFRRGRLLLRGPNGSGKSMALELLLPFLLDGDTSPSRLTSSAKPRGRLFDRVMTGSDDAARTGFAWVEFRRGHEIFTAGARIRASRATGRADVDLWTTSLAVGRELRLLDQTRTPLSRKALGEAIGDTGRVHASAEDHRAAVREVLFPGFSADRYASVIAALLALRKEKLSQNLDLDKLSAVLSEALPPIDDHDIATVAEGFERLDRRRAELAALERDLTEVRQLARQQRDYARSVVVAVATEVRTAETRRDTVTRTERQAREQLAEAQGRADAVTDERARVDERLAATDVEIQAHKDSHAYREGAGLADLRSQASSLRNFADRAADDAKARAGEHENAVAEAREAAQARATAAANLDMAERELRSQAETCGADQVIAEATALADTDVEEGERFLRAWIGAARSRIDDVRTALRRHADAVMKRDLVAEQAATDESAVERQRAAHDAAAREADAELDRYGAAVDGWAAGCEAIGAQRLVEALSTHASPRHPSTVLAAISAVRADVAMHEATQRQDVLAQRETAERERVDLLAERARWEHPALVDPDPPSWRSNRADLPGAPLWRLVDVRPDAPADRLDAIEAALHAAGLLDAWVTPDGEVDLGPQRADVVLSARPASWRSLVDVLAPAADIRVDADVVAAVLASVPVIDSAVDGVATGETPEIAIGLDGTFRLGNAAGRGAVQPGRLLGSVARERHRLAQLAALDRLLADVDARTADLDRQAAALDRWRAAVDAEFAAAPSGDPVLAAQAAATETATRLDEARRRLETTRDRLREAEDGVRAALRELTGLAARHSLPAELSGLARVEEALQRLADITTTWAHRRHDVRRAQQWLERANRREAEAAQAAGRATDNRATAEREATSCEQRVSALQSSIGEEYSAVLHRIADLEGERTNARQRARDLASEEVTLAGALGKLHADVEAAAAARSSAEAERDEAQRRMVAAFACLAADAGVEVDGSLAGATAVLEAARAVAARYERVETSQQVVQRLSQRVADHVHAAQAVLGARVDLEREYADEGWWLLRVRSGGLRRTVGELSTALATELEEGRAELKADEERLFEQTLAGSVRQALAARIRQANALVDGINRQLAAVRTVAAGVQVRLRWDVDPEQSPAVKAARTLLLRDPADLSDEERASLQEFVRARVDQARAELAVNAPWEERLRESLDYRAWHRFTLQLAHRDWEGFQPATARRLQTLSTGERSMALHLPMIASVAAHYTGDDGTPSGCPRLILLDELFAGVDAANRAQLFGTFSTWQLDAVFTSDHEWCQYAELDGIAVHHLHPPVGDDPVTSTRFTWDGRRRAIDDLDT
jgi:uncharacterized protein (TIGR02680 family)